MVGIPGIEPGVLFSDGFTIRCRTLRHDTHILVESTGLTLTGILSPVPSFCRLSYDPVIFGVQGWIRTNVAFQRLIYSQVV